MTARRLSARHSIPSLHSLVLFETAARHLSFSKAAEELSLSQPAVSQGIRQLETSLGWTLFVRRPRALGLTSHGLQLFGAVSGSLASIAETVGEIASVPQRNIVVLAASTITATEWLLPRLDRLRRHDPSLLVDLRCVDRDPDLETSGIDVHCRLGDGRWPGLSATHLWKEILVAVCSPGFGRRLGRPGGVEDLLGQDLIHYVDPHRFRIGWAEWLRAGGASPQVDIPSAVRTNDPIVALRAAESGDGIALAALPLVHQALADGRLMQAHPFAMETGSSIYAVTLMRSGRRRVVAAVCAWLAEEGERSGAPGPDQAPSCSA